MSLQFNNTTLKNGIIQGIERNLSMNDGQISGNALLLAQFTADVNLAKMKLLSIILPACGPWQVDDTNQTDYPIIKTNLVSGQRDYPFTTDGSGNVILDIYRVFTKISATSSFYQELNPKDLQSDYDAESFNDGQDITGVPNSYDKTGNSIFLDPIPNFNASGGLKVHINRESTFYVVADTTKPSGFAGIYDEYLSLRPSYQYAYRKSLKNTNSLEKEMLKMEAEIVDYYSHRDRDSRDGLYPEPIIFQ